MTKYKNNVITSVNNNVRTIIFNCPEKRNALSKEAYMKITSILEEDSKNDHIVATIFTGAGDFYSSGSDLSSAFNDRQNSIDEIVEHFKNFVAALINYPKLLIAVVNGPAVGIAVTSLALCDVVYASDKATFHTPFLNIGLCPEACSSFLFPLILGRSKANEMLLLGHKMTAKEAYEFGFVSKIVPHQQIEKLLQDLHKYGSIPVNCLKKTKQLVNKNQIKTLLHVNEEECDLLLQCIQSEEFLEKLTEFMLRKKSKL